jgi:hypothetical protein
MRLVSLYLGLDGVESPQRRRQVEEVLFAPGAGQVLRDLLDTLPAGVMAECRQSMRVALASHDGAYDRHTRSLR